MAIQISKLGDDGQLVDYVFENHEEARKALSNNKPDTASKEPKEAPEEISEDENDETTANSEAEEKDDKKKSKKEKDDLSYLNSDDDSEEDEDDKSEEEDEEDEDSEKTTKKSGFKKRVDKLTKSNTELKEELARLKEALLTNNRQPQSQAQDKPEDTPKDLIKPKLNDFENYDEYMEALTDYKLEVYKKEQEALNYKSKVDAEAQKQISNWDSKVEEAKKRYKDWDNIKNSQAPLTTFMRTVIMDSDVGPDIVYYLYKNPEKANEIAKLASVAQVRAISRIETKLESDSRIKKQPTLKTTAAPSPVKPVNKSNNTMSGKKNIFSAGLTPSEYRAMRMAEKQKK